MSFQETRSEIDICNKALSRIGQQSLSGSLLDPANRNKLAGRECALWYKTTVRRLLEQHHWNMATERASLVAVTNSRALEWPYAYAAPTDMAFPVSISPLPSGVAAGAIGYYRGVQGLLAKLYNRPMFLYSKGIIYSFQTDAEIEYVSFNITEQDFTQEFEDLVVEFLSAKLARSVAKDTKLAAEYEQQAIKGLNAAIANNLNQQRPRYDMLPSESELARAGVDPWLSGFIGTGVY